MPAELVLANSCYRPEMVGLDLPCGTYIHINGTDIVRDRAGEFLVLEDNARSPSGVSYVVENRHLMQRAFPDLMAGLNVRSVSDYGTRLLGKLREVAPSGVDNPNVVLLSPGIFNSAYFEHVFLAREMGVPLVEGRDLVVEDDRVWAHTIVGREPVHVIYRRINDDFLDPEVFNPSSMLGLRGLLRAVRRGTVTLANAIGTGVADDKAVYAYVPRIIEYYLDEKPILANVETHICGEPEGLAYTLANLDRLVLKPVGELGGYGIVIGPEVDQGRDRGGGRQVESRSRQLHQSADDRLVGCADAGREWRAPSPRRSAAVCDHRPRYLGAARRIDARGTQGRFAHRQLFAGRRHQGYLGPGRRSMRLLSRNAEGLFWLARYLERAASLARVIEMQSSFGGHDQEKGWNWLLTLHTDEPFFRERFEASVPERSGAGPDVTADAIIAFYLTDIANPGSIRSSVHWARENARALRPFIPLDMWTQLNLFHGMIEEIGADDIQRSQLPRTCSRIRAGCLTQIGVTEGLLYRDEGYQFFKLGLMIERADQTSRLLDVKYAQSNAAVHDDFLFWSTILRTVGAFQVFHRLEQGQADPERVARFLAFNPSHPRSIGFCAREICDALHMLRAGFRLSKTSGCLETSDVLMEGLQRAGQDSGLIAGLHGFNDWVQRILIDLTADIGAAFFRGPPRERRADPPPPPLPPPRPQKSGKRQKQSQGGGGQSQSQS